MRLRSKTFARLEESNGWSFNTQPPAQGSGFRPSFASEHTPRTEFAILPLAIDMNKEESDRIHDLCSRIADEHDHKKFLALVEELNRVLSNRKLDPEEKK